MKHDFIRRVLVIGAEPMVSEIAWQCAAHGYEVVLITPLHIDNEERLETSNG